MATKAKKPATKKAPAKKPVARKAPAKKSAARSARVTRRPLITRSEEYTQLTWVLISVWLLLIAVFLLAVIKHVN